MKLADMQVVGNQLALKWDDGDEQFIALDELRKACPCAVCVGEIDVLGQMHKGPSVQLNNTCFQVNRLQLVGGYAIQVFWGDNHSTGLYSFDLLRKMHSGG